MSIHVCPNCRQNYLVSNDCSDYSHQCYDFQNTTNVSITQEDVKVVGNWVDYTGSATIDSKERQQTAGEGNKLFGTVASIEQGAKVPDLSPRGKNTQTYRQRGYIHFIPNLKKIGPGPQRTMEKPSELKY